MADALGDSLERICISGDNFSDKKDADVDVGRPNLVVDEQSKSRVEVVDVENSSSTSSNNRPILICDAWYGFPKQKRPRKERINAVSRQLSNFIQWQSSADSSGSRCHLSLLGSEGDVQAVHDRMDELADQSECINIFNSVDKFQSNVSIHEFLDQRVSKSMDGVVYLSPDASHTLSTTSPPPRTVIIGMLIDRRITTDRSRIRAEETLNLRAAKLPLSMLNVKELTSQEPLNVDTAMELMQRWWWNCDKMKDQQHEESNDGYDKIEQSMYRQCFLEAAAWAMKSQRERHPNRTVHITEKN